MWNIENSDESYSFDEFSEEHPEFPAIYADLFKDELKNKIVLNSKRLTFGTPSFESLHIGVGINSAPESGSSTVIKIPSSVKIGNYVFMVDFFNADDTISDITEIHIPFTVSYITSNTFLHADSLQEAYFTNPYYWKANGSILTGLDNESTAVTTLKGVASYDIEVCFQDIDETEIVYEKNVSSYDAIAYHKDHSTDDECFLLKNVFIRSEQSVSSYGNMPVKSIKYKDDTRGAFENCANLESVVLPRSLTLIDTNAFKGCTNLANIYFAGTKEEWNSTSFEKKTGWHEDCPATKVVCFDGEITL